MATITDLFQIIAGKEVMLYDLKNTLTERDKEIATLRSELMARDKAKGNGKDADTAADESTRPSGS